MPKYWMITNRKQDSGGSRLTGDRSDQLSFWTSEGGKLDSLAAWTRTKRKAFYESLKEVAGGFPDVARLANEDQKHVCLFVHGYNNDWQDAVRRYRDMCRNLFAGPKGLGVLVLFTWPSDGMVTNYLPDRADAERSAGDLVDILGDLYDWLLELQGVAARRPEAACRAKTSIIAHSMGNYVLQRAARAVWTRKNQPLLVSLINQLVMVAADVDNDLFSGGEVIDKSDGDALANLTYRITAMYCGYDQVLGLSAGLKHFGKRRLGRSGLDDTRPVPDNVWHIDCSPYFAGSKKFIKDAHSAYFESPRTIGLIRDVLSGVDRVVVVSKHPKLVPAERP